MSIKQTVPLEVGIACRDLPRLRAFYEDVLGLQFVSEIQVPADKAREAAMCPEGYTVVRLQTSYGERIKLLTRSTPTEPTPASAWILDRPGTTYLTFIIDDIQAAITRLLAAGLDFSTGPHPVDVRPGVQLAFCRDPEGNLLELVQYANIGDYRPDLQQGAV